MRILALRDRTAAFRQLVLQAAAPVVATMLGYIHHHRTAGLVAEVGGGRWLRRSSCAPPAAVAVYMDPPKGSPRNVIQDRVAALEPNGTLVRVRGAAGLAADITPVAAVELGLHTGAGVWFVVKAAEIAVYPTNGSGRAARSG